MDAFPGGRCYIFATTAGVWASSRSPLTCVSAGQAMSGRGDSNSRPPAPKAGALTRLRYAPFDLRKRSNSLPHTVPTPYYSGVPKHTETTL